jgi:hypothetical protein
MVSQCTIYGEETAQEVWRVWAQADSGPARDSVPKVFHFSREGIVGLLENVPERNVGEINSHDGIGVTARELFCDGAAPVSAMRPKSPVA